MVRLTIESSSRFLISAMPDSYHYVTNKIYAKHSEMLSVSAKIIDLKSVEPLQATKVTSKVFLKKGIGKVIGIKLISKLKSNPYLLNVQNSRFCPEIVT